MKKTDSVAPGIVLFLTLISTIHFANAQVSHPEAGFIFDDAELARIDLTITASNLQSLYADPESNTEYFARFSMTRVDSTEGPLDVAVRFRGDTIRHKQKKSFRISFNSFDSD
jgi:spore coat protein CotH